MNRTDAALFESLATEMVRRPGDKITPGKKHGSFSTFTAKSGGGKEEEGTAFKAKTADGKVVPIIMRGEAGKGGTAEVIIPGGKRMGLSIQQASKLRQNISMYDLSDVKKLVDAIKKGGKLPEHIEESTKTTNTPGKKPIKWGGGLLLPGSGTEVARDPFTHQRGHWLYTDRDGHNAIGLTSSQYQSPKTKTVYQMEIHWAGAERPGPGVKAEYWFAARKDSGAFLGALSKRFSNFDSLSDHWWTMYQKTFGKQTEDVDPVADVLLIERAPPGWAGTVKAMKKHMPDERAFALAWSMHKKGAEPHYKDTGSTKSKKKPEKKAEYKGESFEEVEMQESNGDQDDLTFIADPAKLQNDIEQKLGLADMKSPADVLKTISTMYSAKEVPAAVYAAASGMARAEQRVSASMAKAMNQLSAADVAGAIMKGIEGTKAPTIKNLEGWWMSKIAELVGDRGDGDHQNTAAAGVLPAEVEPYISSMAAESINAAFEQVMGDAQGDQVIQPIGSGALSGPEAIGVTDGYSVPDPMGGNEDLATETGVSPAAAAAGIRDGRHQSNRTARAAKSSPDLPGENRVKPGQYTAEELDELDFKTRLRMAEAYDRLVGGAPDLGQEEIVDAEAYKSMLQNRHSNPVGTSTPVATPEGRTGGEVVVNDVDLDAVFDEVAEEERAA